MDTGADNFEFHILSSKIYAITFDVLVFRRGIVSVSVSRYFRQVSYRSSNFGIVTTLPVGHTKEEVRVCSQDMSICEITDFLESSSASMTEIRIA